MALADIINTKVPEETLGEKKMSDRETYLLKALLYLLLYSGLAKGEGEFKNLLFVSGATRPTNLASEKVPVG